MFTQSLLNGLVDSLQAIINERTMLPWQQHAIVMVVIGDLLARVVTMPVDIGCFNHGGVLSGQRTDTALLRQTALAVRCLLMLDLVGDRVIAVGLSLWVGTDGARNAGVLSISEIVLARQLRKSVAKAGLQQLVPWNSIATGMRHFGHTMS